jgi:co-chaperonin GroES (HSP10)
MKPERKFLATADGIIPWSKELAKRSCPLVVGAVVLGLLLCGQSAWAQQSGPRMVSATATLSVLTGTVRHVAAGSSQPQAAKDGMPVAVGDRVLTAPKSEALVTFLDGSTLAIMPDSDVMVKKATMGSAQGAGSAINIQINVGKVWGRVVKFLDPNAGMSLESNTARATVHDGLIGGQQDQDGTFTCWTKAGGMTVTDRQGRTLILLPGEKTVVKADQQPVPQPFAVHASSIKLTVSSQVLPLLLMPDKARVAGFVSPGVEVNQVFGSFTAADSQGGHVVEVPAGVAGPFLLILEGRQDGPFKVDVVGLFQGTQVYRQELSGTTKKGERFSTEITQQMDPTAAGDPKTAKVQSGMVTPLRPLDGPLPGNFLLSPEELRAAGGS